MIKLFKNANQIVTVNSEEKNYKKGSDLNEVGILENHNIVVENDTIKDFVTASATVKKIDQTIDLKGRVILPGLIDCHTHTAFAGSRANEFREKISGVDYEEIANRGGGIKATVKAVRESSHDELINLIQPRIDYFIQQGVTTLEIKSGYGLSFYDEIKLLQVINQLNAKNSIDIIPTFLGAHTFPQEYVNDHDKYVDIIIHEMLPYISKNNLATFVDAFCEKTAFSVDEVDNIFKAAVKEGFELKLHTDQFNSIGGIELGLKYKVTSIDHLEVVNDSLLNSISKSDTVSVLLPGVSFFLSYDYAPARKLIDNGAIVALSTDYNPGSSHIANVNLIMSLAALNMKMSIEETISAFTINAAKALNMQSSVGSIEPGKKADFCVLETDDFADLVYQVGKNINCMTIKNGEIIYTKN
jgi:imidazolonepropionase